MGFFDAMTITRGQPFTMMIDDQLLVLLFCGQTIRNQTVAFYQRLSVHFDMILCQLSRDYRCSP